RSCPSTAWPLLSRSCPVIGRSPGAKGVIESGEQCTGLAEVSRSRSNGDPSPPFQVEVASDVLIPAVLMRLVTVVLQRDAQLRPAQIEHIPNAGQRIEHRELLRRRRKARFDDEQLQPAFRRGLGPACDQS